MTRARRAERRFDRGRMMGEVVVERDAALARATVDEELEPSLGALEIGQFVGDLADREAEALGGERDGRERVADVVRPERADAEATCAGRADEEIEALHR